MIILFMISPVRVIGFTDKTTITMPIREKLDLDPGFCIPLVLKSGNSDSWSCRVIDMSHCHDTDSFD
jgi:hypothetical protein